MELKDFLMRKKSALAKASPEGRSRRTFTPKVRVLLSRRGEYVDFSELNSSPLVSTILSEMRGRLRL